MNNNPYTGFYPDNNREPRTLTTLGSVLYAAIATLLCTVSSMCLRTDGEHALMCVIAPVFMIGGAYFLSALLVHGRLPLFICSAAASVICPFVLTFDIARSLLCLGAYAAALCVYLSTRKKYFTHSGNICLCTAVYAVWFLLMLCVLCIQKYGWVGADTLGRAYDSFKAIMLSSPKEYLSLLEAGVEGVTEADIEYYRTLVNTLDKLLGEMVYVLPSLFLCICSIGGFITVRGVRYQRKMAGQEDTVGIFEISAISAVLYLIFNLIAPFVKYDSVVGITVQTVSAPLGLGLAFAGLLFALGWLRLNSKGPMYYVGFVLIAVAMPNVCVSLLAYLGTYRCISLALKQYIERKGGTGKGNSN